MVWLVAAAAFGAGFIARSVLTWALFMAKGVPLTVRQAATAERDHMLESQTVPEAEV